MLFILTPYTGNAMRDLHPKKVETGPEPPEETAEADQLPRFLQKG